MGEKALDLLLRALEVTARKTTRMGPERSRLPRLVIYVAVKIRSLMLLANGCIKF